MSAGWLIFMFTLFLGGISYLICLKIIWPEKTQELVDYLFEGNNNVVGAFSIIGTIFSTAVFFTAITALYILYGFLILPIFLICSLSGFYLIKKKSIEIFSNTKRGIGSQIFVNRYKHIANAISKPHIYFSYLFIYLFLMLTTEIAAFNNVISVFIKNDFWASYIVYFIIITVVAYVYLSGFKGVLVTDTIQTLMIVILLILMIFFTSSLDISKNVSEIFLLPPLKDASILIIGATLICIAWFSTSPEIWFRVISLRNKKDVKKTMSLAMFFLPIVIALPFVIIIFTELTPQFHGDSTVAFEVWANIFEKNNEIIFILFLSLMITAFFTTLDTFIITFSQILYCIKDNNVLEKFLPSNPRYFSIIFTMVCLLIGLELQPIFNGIIGIYAGCLMIPVFMLTYVYPFLQKKKVAISYSSSSFLLQLIVACPIIIFIESLVVNPNYSHLGYPFIPIIITFIEIVLLFVNYILSKNKLLR